MSRTKKSKSSLMVVISFSARTEEIAKWRLAAIHEDRSLSQWIRRALNRAIGENGADNEAEIMEADTQNPTLDRSGN